jgi:hypothetical protein
VPCADLEMDFASRSGRIRLPSIIDKEAEPGHVAADGFISSLRAMQRELFISYLRFPRIGEVIVLQKYECRHSLWI